jgi:hypothetical protein
MTLGIPRSGLSNANEYQSAGLPWCYTSSSSATTTAIRFPRVTRSIMLANNGAATDKIAITFANPTGSVERRFELSGGSMFDMELRVTSIYVTSVVGTGSFSVMAALTTILASDMPTLMSGSWEGV